MTVYSGPDIASKQLLDALEEHMSTYKSVTATLAAADGDKDKAILAFKEGSDDPQVVKLRDQIAKLEAKLHEYAQNNAEVVTLSDDERKKLEEQQNTLRGTINKGINVVESVAKTINTDYDNVMAALNELGNPTKGNRGRKPGQTGSSLPRISATLTIKEVSEGGDQALVGKVFESFSQFALKYDMEVKDLQLAFAEAANVKHEDIKTVDKPIEFAVQPNDNGAVYILQSTPKERAPRGSKTEGSKKEEAAA